MISAILKYSIGSLFYGGLITVVFISLFVLLIKGWYKDAIFKPITFAVFGVLTLFVFANSTIICGALAIKSDITTINASVENIIEESGLKGDSEVDSLQTNKFMQEVTDRYPIINSVVGQFDISGSQVAELPAMICNTLTGYLTGIIIKSLLWTLAFVVIGVIVVIKTLDHGSSNRVSSRYGERGNSRVQRYDGRIRRISSRSGGRRRYS